MYMYRSKKTENSRNYLGEDYFSPRLGFVIEGQCMTYETAVVYLTRSCDMLMIEVQNYLTHLQKSPAMRVEA